MKKIILFFIIQILVQDLISQTFIYNYTGQIDTFVVPSCVSQIRITSKGAEGGYNSSSGVLPGKGASITGTFNVLPGDSILILVGEQPSSGGGNGGGGGSFVVRTNMIPLVIAGGGGGSAEGTDSFNKHGNITQTGGNGAAGGGMGGSSGNGGSIGSSGFQSGAGGGFFTDGSNGWVSNTGGLSFLNGGSGGTANANARGGFGGGGSGSSYVVGGGGGGYSGGGSGSNSAGPGGVGGGGGSYNGGIPPIADSTGVRSGHGIVIIEVIPSSPSSIVLSDSVLQTISCYDSSDAIIQLYASGGIGDPFTFNFNGNGYSPDSIYSSLTAGTYWFTAMDGCSNLSDTAYVTLLNPDSIYAGIVITPENVGGDGSISATGMGGSGTLQFSLDGGAFQSSGDFNNLVGGSYVLTIIDSVGCSRNYTVNVPSFVSVGSNIHINEITSYPNPVRDVLYIQLKSYPKAIIRLEDLKGALILNKFATDEELIQLDMSSVSQGVYILKVLFEEQVIYVNKIIK